MGKTNGFMHRMDVQGWLVTEIPQICQEKIFSLDKSKFAFKLAIK